ncbi:ashwin [Petromyzon marinus]|uniref:ashwin n=1 Tax=Petromyzon marinus TaxID=7757 RepID=UPI003F6F407B
MARGGEAAESREEPPQPPPQLHELLLGPPAEQQRAERLCSAIAQRGVAALGSLSGMDHAQLVALYRAHVLPLPQRELRGDSNWAQRVIQRGGTRAAQSHATAPAGSPAGLKHWNENRKRPLIVFDGASTKTVIKVRRVSAEGGGTNLPATEGKVAVKSPVPSLAQVSPRLPEPSNGAVPTSPSCVLSKGAIAPGGDAVSSVKVKRVPSVDPKREEKSVGSPEVKSKIQRIKWP